MKLKKLLGYFRMTGFLTLGLIGCGDNLEYHYNGKIGPVHVKFYETNVGAQNYLEVIQPDGKKITYHDKNDDGKLDDVFIEKGDYIKRYINDVIGKPILDTAQTQYDSYLEQIIEIKINTGLENLK